MKQFKYFLMNGIFVACIYFGLFENIEGAKNLTLFIAWFTSIMSLFLLTNAAQENLVKVGKAVPRWLDVTLDISIIATFVWFNWVWTGVAYTIHLLMVVAAWQEVEKTLKANKVSAEGETNGN